MSRSSWKTWAKISLCFLSASELAYSLLAYVSDDEGLGHELHYNGFRLVVVNNISRYIFKWVQQGVDNS